MRTLDHYQTEVFRLYLEKKYADSLKVALEAAEQFGDKTARTTFWIACLNARLGRLDEALEALDAEQRDYGAHAGPVAKH